MSNQPIRIDVDSVLRERLPRHYKYIPRFAVRWLERTICQDRLNAILTKMAGRNSVDAATAALHEMDITVKASGMDRLPDGRYMFVSTILWAASTVWHSSRCWATTTITRSSFWSTTCSWPLSPCAACSCR